MAFDPNDEQEHPLLSTPEGYSVPDEYASGISQGKDQAQGYYSAAFYIDPLQYALSSGASSAAIPMSTIAAGGSYRFGDGTVTSPAVSWLNETNSGRYRISLNNFGESVNGVLTHDWNTSRMKFASGYSLGLGVEPTSPLHIRSTTNPQFQIDYDSAHKATFQLDSVGDLYVTTTDQTYIFRGNTISQLYLDSTGLNPLNALYFSRSLSIDWSLYESGAAHDFRLDSAGGTQIHIYQATGNIAFGPSESFFWDNAKTRLLLNGSSVTSSFGCLEITTPNVPVDIPNFSSTGPNALMVKMTGSNFETDWYLRGGLYTDRWLVLSGTTSGTGTTFKILHPSTDGFMIGIWSDIVNGPAMQIRAGTNGTPNRLMDYLDSGTAYVQSVMTDGSIQWGAGTFAQQDTGLVRDGAGILHVRFGTNPMEFRVANTWTSGANTEYFRAVWASNHCYLSTTTVGGTHRPLSVGSEGNTVALRASGTDYVSLSTGGVLSIFGSALTKNLQLSHNNTNAFIDTSDNTQAIFIGGVSTLVLPNGNAVVNFGSSGGRWNNGYFGGTLNLSLAGVAMVFTNATTLTGGNTGTFTNCPHSGNPTGYLEVSINGATKCIPYFDLT